MSNTSLSSQITVPIANGAKEIKVHQATHGDGLVRIELSAQAEQLWLDNSPASPAEKTSLLTAVRQYDQTYVLPSLLACSTGDVPTGASFQEVVDAYNAMSEEDSEAWLEAATKLNRRWFELTDTNPEAAKKKPSSGLPTPEDELPSKSGDRKRKSRKRN